MMEKASRSVVGQVHAKSKASMRLEALEQSATREVGIKAKWTPWNQDALVNADPIWTMMQDKLTNWEPGVWLPG